MLLRSGLCTLIPRPPLKAVDHGIFKCRLVDVSPGGVPGRHVEDTEVPADIDPRASLPYVRLSSASEYRLVVSLLERLPTEYALITVTAFMTHRVGGPLLCFCVPYDQSGYMSTWQPR